MMKLLDDTIDIKNEYLCPITGDLMNDPVIAEDGTTYERGAIKEWLKLRGTSPLTRQTMSANYLISNRNLKSCIEQFIKEENSKYRSKQEANQKSSNVKIAIEKSNNSDFEYAAKFFSDDVDYFSVDSKLELSNVEYDRDQLFDWNTILENQKQQLSQRLQEKEVAIRKLLFQQRQAIVLPLEEKIRLEKSLAQINEKLLNDPFDGKNINIKVSLLKKLQRQPEALRLLDQALNRDKNNLYLLTARAHLLKEEGRLSAALEDYKKVLSIEPNNSWALSGIKGILKTSTEISNFELSYLEGNGPIQKSKGVQFNQRAKQFKSAGKIHEALEVLNQGIEQEPKNIFLLTHRGDIYRKIGKTQEALKDYDRVLQLCPGHTRAEVGKRKLTEQHKSRMLPTQPAALQHKFVTTKSPQSSSINMSSTVQVNLLKSACVDKKAPKSYQKEINPRFPTPTDKQTKPKPEIPKIKSSSKNAENRRVPQNDLKKSGSYTMKAHGEEKVNAPMIRKDNKIITAQNQYAEPSMARNIPQSGVDNFSMPQIQPVQTQPSYYPGQFFTPGYAVAPVTPHYMMQQPGIGNFSMPQIQPVQTQPSYYPGQFFTPVYGVTPVTQQCAVQPPTEINRTVAYLPNPFMQPRR